MTTEQSKYCYQICICFIRTSVMNNERIDSENAENSMNFFVVEIVSESTRFSEKVDQRLTSTTRRFVEVVVVVHQHRYESETTSFVVA